MNKFYLTTTIPYVNAEPHIGFALEIIQADVIARFKKLQGHDVFFNFGTDEHGLKIYRKALELKKDPKKYCDEYAEKFSALKQSLNLSYNNFIRTTDPHHLKAAQEFWRRCLVAGDIYKKNYKIKYCVGCELEKTDSELENGRCSLHPNQDIEVYEEENYFFRFSKFQKQLLKLYDEQPDFVMPSFRLKEIRTFVEQGLEDFSISRLKSKMPWGVDVPDDPKHVMYVWFDALVNYISAIGWPEDLEKFNSWWPVTQFAGKDNLRQQCAIWQAMLFSAGLPNSQQIFIHGFITVAGQKISKSSGNVVNPLELVKKYGTDPLRYYLLREIPAYGDGDYSENRFKELYNADLANNLGNLVSRVLKLVKTSGFKVDKNRIDEEKIDRLKTEIGIYLQNYQFDKALEFLIGKITDVNKEIDERKPWKQQSDEVLKSLVNIIITSESTYSILEISEVLNIFLPDTAKKIKQFFLEPNSTEEQPLFPRIE